MAQNVYETTNVVRDVYKTPDVIQDMYENLQYGTTSA